MAKNYLSVVYDEKSHPYSDYPKKLCAYLFQSFGFKEGMKMLEPGCGRGEFLKIKAGKQAACLGEKSSVASGL